MEIPGCCGRYNGVLIAFYTSVFIALLLVPQVQAAQTETVTKEGKDNAVFVSKSITGKVGTVKRDYVTVIYNQRKTSEGAIEDSEMVLPIDKKTILTNKKSMGDIKEGDEITVSYSEATWIDKGATKKERKAQSVKFISPAVQGLRSI